MVYWAIFWGVMASLLMIIVIVDNKRYQKRLSSKNRCIDLLRGELKRVAESAQQEREEIVTLRGKLDDAQADVIRLTRVVEEKNAELDRVTRKPGKGGKVAGAK